MSARIIIIALILIFSRPSFAEIWPSYCFSYVDFVTAEAQHAECVGIVSDPSPIDEINATDMQILAQSLDNHAAEINQLNENMVEFFTLSTTDFSLITAVLFATFITGNSLGKLAHIMRKT